jgi:TRAP-type C4-dicarboxylate transport system substrate-binding protein
MFMNKLFGKGVALAVGAAMLAPSVAAAEELRFAHFVPPQHVITPSIVEPLVNAVNAAGTGIEIKVYPGGELGPGPVEQYSRVLAGVADMAWGLAGYTSSQFPRSMIIEMPGVVKETGKGYEQVWAAYEDHLTSEFPGTKPLALWTSEPNVLIMRDKEIRTPDDMKGLKIRVSGSVSGEVVEAFGAVPVQMPANEMYNALQTGLIDGIVTGASAIRDFRLNEVANVYTEGPALGNILFYVVMNQQKYDALNDAQKKVIDDNSGVSLSASGESGWNAVADQTMEMLKADPAKTVITLTDAEAAVFSEIAMGVTERLIADMDAKGIDASATMAAMKGM